MKEIQLTQGQVAKVCDCHYHLVAKHKWYAQWIPQTQSFYAARRASLPERLLRSPSKIKMHVVINNTPKGFLTDHQDRDTLNNQCTNLRTATPAENSANRKKQSDNQSGYKGVCWDPRRRNWRAYLTVNGKNKSLGRYATPEIAARTYDKAAIELLGEFANLNFPRSDYP